MVPKLARITRERAGIIERKIKMVLVGRLDWIIKKAM